MRLRNLACGVAALALSAAGCHPRSSALASAASYDVAQTAIEGTFGKTLEATLGDDGSQSGQGFRFEVKAPGSLTATAKALGTHAQLTLAVYREGGAVVAMGEPGKNVEAKGLTKGTYYVAVAEAAKDAVRTQVALRVVFKPQDPDAAETVCKTKATARALVPDAAPVQDSVDYSEQRRTCYFRLSLAAEGAVAIQFDNRGNNISAEFVPARGSPEKIDPNAGLIKDLPAGDSYVKVFANDAGDGGPYALSASVTQEDTCKNGGPACSIEGAEDLKLPSDVKTAEVDYKKSEQFHFYKVSPNEKGKLTIGFKILQPPRGSKVQAFFMRAQDDDGERLTAASTTKDVEQPGDYFIRVQAPDKGDAAKYTVSVLWSPANFIPGEVVEIGRAPCLLTVSAGSNQGVRAGVACTVVSASGQPIDACVVDQTFPNLSKVRPANARCNVQSNATVQISVQ